MKLTERIINIRPIKKEFTNLRGYKKTSWSCELEIVKFDGTSRILKGYTFMNSEILKRDAVNNANKYKDYLLSQGDFYFI
jgi:hypothetical protein